jgi:hypothetical protein
LVHPLQQIVERIEPVLPEARHLAGPVDQRIERTGLRAVMGLASFMAVTHQARLLQRAEMFRDRRLGNAGLRRQCPDRLLALAAKPLEDRPPCRVGKRPEQKIGVVDMRNP